MRRMSLAFLLCCLLLTGLPAQAASTEKNISSASESANAPNKRALLVGVSKYARTDPAEDWWDLSSDRDVDALKDVLLTKFGFKESEVKVLKTKEETTHEAIVKTFRSFLIEPTRPGDIIYFHYSGHGSQVPDESRRKPSGMHQCLVPSDYVSRTDGSKNILDDEIRDLLAELKRKRPANVTLSFDCCFAGTITRGGRMVVRGQAWTGPRPKPVTGARGQEAGPGGLLPRGEALAQGYVVITATRSDQLAVELPNESMGLMTYALSKALQGSGPQTTYRDLFERLNTEMSRHSRDQNPQLEGEMDKVLLQGMALKPERYIPVNLDRRDNLLLQAGELQGVTKGSLFALYPAGTKDFKNATPLAEATVEDLRLTAAALKLTKGFEGKVKPEALKAARAVEKSHQYGDNLLKVDTQRIEGHPRRKQVLAALESLPLANSKIKAGDHWDVRICPDRCPDRKPDEPDVAASPEAHAPQRVGSGGSHSGGFELQRQDGSVVTRVADGEDLPRQLGSALEGEARWRFVNSLESRNPDSQIRVKLRLVPVDVELDSEGNPRVDARGMPTKIVDRKEGLNQTAGGQVMLSEGDHVMIELTNLGYMDAYVTILDLRSDGKIGPVWPHPDVKSQENKIPADGKPHRIPWPFLFRIDKPYGKEIFKVVATSEPADFSPLVDRETLERGMRGSRPRGEREQRAANSPLGQLLMAATLGKRATLTGVSPSYWSSDAVTFEVVPRK